MQALSKLARTSDEKVINSITKWLHADRNDIRYEAIVVLATIVQEGNPITISALIASASDDDCQAKVREAAIGALVKIAGKGHETTICALTELAANANACDDYWGFSDSVRGSALAALDTIANRGDAKVINASIKLLQEGSLLSYRCTCQTC